MNTCNLCFERVQIMQDQPQRTSLDFGELYLSQLALLHATIQKTAEKVRASSQKCPICGYAFAILAHKNNVPEIAAIQ